MRISDCTSDVMGVLERRYDELSKGFPGFFDGVDEDIARLEKELAMKRELRDWRDSLQEPDDK